MSPGPSPNGPGRSQTFGASERRAQAGLEPRIGRPPCSPATFPVVTPGEGTRVCGVHTNAEAARRTEGTTGCDDAARPAADRRAWRNDSGRRGAAIPLPGPGAELSTRRRGRGHGLARSPAPPCSARSARPHCRGGGPRCRDGRRKPEPSADVDTRPLAAKTGKLDNVAPGQRSGHGHSVSREL